MMGAAACLDVVASMTTEDRKAHTIARLQPRPQMSAARVEKAGAAPAWLDWLASHGVDWHAVSLALGVDYDTVRHWHTGSRGPSTQALRALRLLAALLSIAPSLRDVLTLGSDEDVARAVNGLRLRAVRPTDPDRTIDELRLRVAAETDDVYTARRTP